MAVKLPASNKLLSMRNSVLKILIESFSKLSATIKRLTSILMQIEIRLLAGRQNLMN